MGTAVHTCAAEAGWKLRVILRTWKFFSHKELVGHFTSHILSYIEYRTPAIYHAATRVLRPIDRILPSFLAQLGITPLQAFVHFNLAPLCTRRDIAMLGLVHRAVLKQGPSHFWQFFVVDSAATRFLHRRHNKHIVDWREGRRLDMLDRSVLGLVPVYSILPQAIVNETSVANFQCRLQRIVKRRAIAGAPGWEYTLSPRASLDSHPLRREQT